MRHRFGRRSRHDAFAPVPEGTWLVTRGPFRDVLEFRELPPGADLWGVLTGEHARRAAEGWAVEPMSRLCTLFFCSRAGTRIMVGIERHDPRAPPLMRG